MVESCCRVAVCGSLPSYRPKASLRHHSSVHRRLGREQNGHAAGEKGQHDQRHHQQRQGGHGEAHPGGHAVSIQRLLSTQCWHVRLQTMQSCRNRGFLSFSCHTSPRAHRGLSFFFFLGGYQCLYPCYAYHELGAFCWPSLYEDGKSQELRIKSQNYIALSNRAMILPDRISSYLHRVILPPPHLQSLKDPATSTAGVAIISHSLHPCGRSRIITCCTVSTRVSLPLNLSPPSTPPDSDVRERVGVNKINFPCSSTWPVFNVVAAIKTINSCIFSDTRSGRQEYSQCSNNTDLLPHVWKHKEHSRRQNRHMSIFAYTILR